MTILQITPHFSPNIGGVETHIDDLVSGLIAKRYKIFVVSYQPLQTKIRWKIYEQEKSLKILRIPWISGLFYKLINKPILEFLYLFPGIFLVTPFVILTQKPDLIHAHGLVAGVVGVIWGKIFNKRTVISTHNIYNFPKSGLYLNIINWIFNNANHTLCLSNQSASEIKKIVNDDNKISVFTSWVNLQKFKPVSLKSKEFTVLFVGRLVKEKGLLELLESSKKWNKNIKLLIAGSGPLTSFIPVKSYLGPISQKKLPGIYSKASLTIVPSIHDEGFGRVVVESLACGTPVIGSNRGAIPDVMDNTVGKLIDVTPENIKKIVEYFYNNPTKLKSLSKNTRKFVQKKYSNKNIDVILSSYFDK